jgi:hypothetical protein
VCLVYAPLPELKQTNKQTNNNNIVCMTANKPLQMVAKLKYLGTTITYQSYIYDEIKSSLNLRNVCYHLV